MRHRVFHRVVRVLAHVRHAARTHIFRPRHVRGSGGASAAAATEASMGPAKKLFFREYRVLRVKSRVYGRLLPPNQLLVKLRVPGRSPMWQMLDARSLNKKSAFVPSCRGQSTTRALKSAARLPGLSASVITRA